MKYLSIILLAILASCYPLKYDYTYQINRKIDTDTLNCYEIMPLKGRKVIIYIWTKQTAKEGQIITIRELMDGSIYLRNVDSPYNYQVSTIIKPSKLIK